MVCTCVDNRRWSRNMAIYRSLAALLLSTVMAFGQAYSPSWSVVVAHTNATTGFITPTNLNTFTTNVAQKAAATVGASVTNLVTDATNALATALSNAVSSAT